ncbi:hypothetical protein Peetri_00219 [Pseudomonas phage vB_PpuM-Peetri]
MNSLTELLTASPWYLMVPAWVVVLAIGWVVMWIIWNVVLRFLKCYARGFSLGLMKAYIAVRSGAPIQYVLYYVFIETIFVGPFHFVREEMFSGVHYSSMTLSYGGTWSGIFQWYIRKGMTRNSWNEWEAERVANKAKQAEMNRRNREEYLRDPDNYDL